MSGQCDHDIEQSIVEALSHAVPRLDERRSREMRGRVLACVRGGEAPYRGLLVNRAIALFAATAAMLGSMSVAAAVAKPGQPAYSLRTAFVAVRRAILPPPTGSSQMEAGASQRPERVGPAVRSQEPPVTHTLGNPDASAGSRERKLLRHLDDAWRPKAQAQRRDESHAVKRRATLSKRVGGHNGRSSRRGFRSKP